MSAITLDRLLVPLPDVDGLVHGIVSLDPPKIQCDGCGLVATGEGIRIGTLVVTCGIRFNTRTYGYGDDRRLCTDCRKAVWS